MVPLSKELIPSAQALVDRVFPKQSLSEWLSFRTYLHRDSLLIRLVYRAAGVQELIGYWVALDQSRTKVIGIAGLYSYIADADTAVWLGWYCIDPEVRGTGLGGKILDFAIERARDTGKAFLRLYTSTDPAEATAQSVYEKKGFHVVEVKPGQPTAIIYREKPLR